MAEFVVAEVRLWDRRVGAVAEDEHGNIVFEYDPAFRKSGLEISPLKLPLSREGPVAFPELRRVEAFQGLPGVLADALPDRFGNAVITRYFQDRGRPEAALSPVQKLLYMGKRGIGALEFRPAIPLRPRRGEAEPLELAELVAQARALIQGKTHRAIPEIMRIGSSAGGARPKAIVLWNRERDEVKSGFAPPEPGDEAWIIKFDGVGELGAPDDTPKPYNRIEAAYAKMAALAGIEVPESRLAVEGGFAHFMSRRFDRQGETKLHFHSLGGLQHADFNAPGSFSYEGFLRTILELNLGQEVLEEGFRRTAFNLAAVNQDDHVKNIGFLMGPDGSWRLAPAYDLTYARGAGFTRQHQMTLGGKRDHFRREYLLELGKSMGIPQQGAPILDRLRGALERWKEIAREAGVPDHRAREIDEAFRRF